MSAPPNLIKVPRLRQATDYTCGVCALQAVLAYYGEDEREDVLARVLKANHKDGTRYQSIADYGRSHGYQIEIKKEAEVADLEAVLRSGRPAICLIQAWGEVKAAAINKGAKEAAEQKPEDKIDYQNAWNDGHYVVAIGFDAEKFYFMDPSTAGTYTFIERADFLKRWHDTDGREKLHNFFMVVSKDKPYDPDAITEIK